MCVYVVGNFITVNAKYLVKIIAQNNTTLFYIKLSNSYTTKVTTTNDVKNETLLNALPVKISKSNGVFNNKVVLLDEGRLY